MKKKCLFLFIFLVTSLAFGMKGIKQPKIKKNCYRCGKESANPKACRICGFALYCSLICKRDDKPHKVICSKLS